MGRPRLKIYTYTHVSEVIPRWHVSSESGVVSVAAWVGSPAQCSGLRIWCCHGHRVGCSCGSNMSNFHMPWVQPKQQQQQIHTHTHTHTHTLLRVPWWYSRLGIWHCFYRGLVYCCSLDLITWPGASTCHVHGIYIHLIPGLERLYTSSIFSDASGMKLKISYKKKCGKNNKYVESEQHATEQLLSQQRNQGRNKFPEDKENEILTYHNLWDAAKAIL